MWPLLTFSTKKQKQNLNANHEWSLMLKDFFCFLLASETNAMLSHIWNPNLAQKKMAFMIISSVSIEVTDSTHGIVVCCTDIVLSSWFLPWWLNTTALRVVQKYTAMVAPSDLHCSYFSFRCSLDSSKFWSWSSHANSFPPDDEVIIASIRPHPPPKTNKQTECSRSSQDATHPIKLHELCQFSSFFKK